MAAKSLAFLAESSTRRRRAVPITKNHRAEISRKLKWFTYDAIDSGIHQHAATQAFGQPVRPVFNFDKAKVILSLDCDFLGGEDDAHNYIARFAKGRKVENGGMSRLYAVESLFTLTGANADHRLRLSASTIRLITARTFAKWFARESAEAAKDPNTPFNRHFDFLTMNSFNVKDVGSPNAPGRFMDENASKWVTECAKDLVAAGKNALVVAGQRQPIEVHLLAYAMNSVLGAIGNTVTLIPWAIKPLAGIAGSLETYENALPTVEAGSRSMIENVERFKKNLGAIDTLVILKGNPVYHLPWFAAEKPKSIVQLGYYEDETSVVSDFHFPAAHYLESWDDVVTSDGTIVPIQPFIQPLFGGLTELEFLARLAGESRTNPYEIVRLTFDGLGWGKTKTEDFIGGQILKAQTSRRNFFLMVFLKVLLPNRRIFRLTG